MELNIKVTTNDSCKITIQDNTTYLPETFTGVAKNNFKRSDTISVDVLRLNKILEAEYKKLIHTKNINNSLILIPIKFDGWFTINHIVLPTKEWFEREINKTEASAISLYSIIYFADEDNIYKYVDNKTLVVDIDEVLEINTINTTISKTSKDYVSICYLRKCYINLCKLMFNDRGFSSCWSKNKIDSELIYKRDLVWMAINVIKYLTECELLNEVLRIIEVLKGCNGVCSPDNLTSKTSGCGCSK